MSEPRKQGGFGQSSVKAREREATACEGIGQGARPFVSSCNAAGPGLSWAGYLGPDHPTPTDSPADKAEGTPMGEGTMTEALEAKRGGLPPRGDAYTSYKPHPPTRSISETTTDRDRCTHRKPYWIPPGEPCDACAGRSVYPADWLRPSRPTHQFPKQGPSQDLTSLPETYENCNDPDAGPHGFVPRASAVHYCLVCGVREDLHEDVPRGTPSASGGFRKREDS